MAEVSLSSVDPGWVLWSLRKVQRWFVGVGKDFMRESWGEAA